MQAGQHPALGEGQAGQCIGVGEVRGRECGQVGGGSLRERHLQEFAGVPQLVGQVAAAHHPVHGQVQVLTSCCACASAQHPSVNLFKHQDRRWRNLH